MIDMAKLNITVYATYFKVVTNSPSFAFLLHSFSRAYVHTGWIRDSGGKSKSVELKVYRFKTYNNIEHRFHISGLEPFMAAVKDKGIVIGEYILKYVNETEWNEGNSPPAIIHAPIRKRFEAKDFQLDAIKHVITEITNTFVRLLGMPTGTGKTFSGLSAASKIGLRTAIVIQPAYLEKWVSDITENLHVPPDRVMLVKGSSHIKEIINMALMDTLDVDFIVISNRTFQNYIKEYELAHLEVLNSGYGCTPDQFFDLLRVGHIMVDESHQHFYTVFMLMLFTNVKHFTAMSATMMSEDPFIKRLYDRSFPIISRFDNLLMKKYIQCFPVDYRINDFKNQRIRINEYGNNAYSHNAFEKSIMHNKILKLSYFKMIYDILNIGYIKYYIKNDKAIVFCSTIALCTELTKYLSEKFRHLDVRRYVEDDPYENVIDSDIRVTTPGSAGTAIDIPQLTTSIITVAMFSPVQQTQVLGRTRELKDGRAPGVYYTYCTDIDKHKQMHYKRVDLFKPKVVSIKQLQYPRPL